MDIFKEANSKFFTANDLTAPVVFKPRTKRELKKLGRRMARKKLKNFLKNA